MIKEYEFFYNYKILKPQHCYTFTFDYKQLFVSTKFKFKFNWSSLKRFSTYTIFLKSESPIKSSDTIDWKSENRGIQVLYILAFY